MAGLTHPAGPQRWLLGIALALSVALVIGVLIAAVIVRRSDAGPLRLAEVRAPAADTADCVQLLAALPARLDGGDQGDLDRRQLVAPVPTGVAGWGDPPVVLRCGLARPAELTATSRLLTVSGVQFLEIPGSGTSNWVAVDRPVYVVMALPPSTGSGPLQQVANVISATLPRRDLDVSG